MAIGSMWLSAVGSLCYLGRLRTRTNKYQLVCCCYVPSTMHEESILGQLPSGWTRPSMDEKQNWSYIIREEQTLQNPPFGPLRMDSMLATEKNEEINHEGELKNLWFEPRDPQIVNGTIHIVRKGGLRWVSHTHVFCPPFIAISGAK
jgi:hypothetical protein